MLRAVTDLEKKTTLAGSVPFRMFAEGGQTGGVAKCVGAAEMEPEGQTTPLRSLAEGGRRSRGHRCAWGGSQVMAIPENVYVLMRWGR